MAGRYSVETIFRGVDKLSRPVRKMQGAVARLGRKAGNALKRMKSSFDRFADSVIRVTKRLGLMTVASVSGGLAALRMVNESTARTAALAESVGASTSLIAALGEEIKSAGFDAEHVVDLMEEMNNKLGESNALEEIKPVEEALEILGLKFKEIKDLAPEEQFKKIMNAAIGMKDAQKAASAADILMGGEANRIISILHRKGMTIEELIDKHKRMSFVSEESTEGATNFTNAWNDSTRILGSVGKAVAGLLGGHLTPLIEKMNEWAIANKDVIEAKIDEWAENVAKALQYLIDNSDAIATWGKRIGIAIGFIWGLKAALAAIQVVMTAVNLVMWANPIMLVVLAVAALTAAGIWLYYNWDQVKELMSQLWQKIVDAYESSGLKTIVDWLVDQARAIGDAFEVALGKVITAFDKIKSAGQWVKDTLGVGDNSPAMAGVPGLVPAMAGVPDMTTATTPGDSWWPDWLRWGDQPDATTAQQAAERTGASADAAREPERDQMEITIRDESGRADLTDAPSSPSTTVRVEETGGL